MDHLTVITLAPCPLSPLSVTTCRCLSLLASGEITGDAIDIACGDIDGSPREAISSSRSVGRPSRFGHLWRTFKALLPAFPI